MCAAIHLVSRGPANQVSGGYLYNRRLLDALRAAGREVHYHEQPSDVAQIPSGDTCIVDALVLGEGLPEIEARTHPPVLLMHMLPDALMRGSARATMPDLSRYRIVVTGERTKEAIRSLPGGQELDLVCIEPGVPDEWRAKACYARVASRLLCVANYLGGKGYRKLIAAIRGLTDLRWTLRAFGNAELQPDCFQALIRQVDRAGLSGRVSLYPGVDHERINAEMLGADLLLVPSIKESYSMVTAEALACGLPVVSNITGANELFRQSGCVRYIDVYNADVFRSTLRELMTNESAYASLASAATMEPRGWRSAGNEFLAWLERGA